MEGNSAVLQTLGQWVYRVYEDADMFQMYGHLMAAALFPIYIGSHASLRRPPSAAKPGKLPSGSEDDAEDESDLDIEPTVEGLTPSDAILFPIFAGFTLAGLYFLIKWLGDAALLNKVLGVYFSFIGVFGVGKLAGDSLNVVTSFVFPSVWTSKGKAYHVDSLLSLQLSEPLISKLSDSKSIQRQALATSTSLETTSNPLFSNQPQSGPMPGSGRNKALVQRKFEEKKSTPFPGLFSSISLSRKNSQRVWSVRALFTKNWIFRGYIHGIMKLTARIRLNDVIGLLLGIAAISVYNLNGKAWWLTNLMGFGFCYGTLQLMSPTTFWTGSLVLIGLFVYDITMVFYTPLMVTVATSLDVPIKLVFPGPKRGSMLGLGDVVLPGIMMALALRFDLYIHYLRKQTTTADTRSSKSVTSPSNTIVKAKYSEATGQWGEIFWTSKSARSALPNLVPGGTFKKTYFNASIIGYILGMIVTLVVLNVFNHAQPALLYLVPGVLGALWGTALVRGELNLMYNYTEDGSLEEDMNEKERENDGNKDTTVSKGDAEGINEISGTGSVEVKQKKVKENQNAHHVFLFSLSAPKLCLEKAKAAEKTA